jgi:hypothetical protein
MRHFLLSLMLWTVLGTALPARGEPAPLIDYQGFLTDAAGAPLSGSKRLTFSLYDSPTAAAAFWGPQIFEGVPVVNGRFDVILGTTDIAGRSLAGVAGFPEKYLGITVDGTEIQPRQTVLRSAPPPAESGANAGEAAPRLDGVPPGTLVAYWSSRIPDGWLLCDGSAVPEGARYDRLRGLIGERVPDLRGLFLRGIGQNADPAFRYEGDAGRTLAQLQQDELKSHAHVFDDYTFSENAGSGGNAWGSAGRSDIDNVPASPYSHSTGHTGGGETRPKNAAVYWIVKY